MSKIVIFASGNGSNARQILRFLSEKKSPVQVVAIFTNKECAGIYDVAKQFSVPISFFSNAQFAHGVAVVSQLQHLQAEWIVLAGFLRKIESSLLQHYENRIINLHPSLLPKYGGKGMYGKYVHQAVLEASEKESGISIHLVNEEFDRGEILFQAKCEVEKGQTVAELAEKIQKLEHSFFPKVIEQTVLSSVNS